jgi:hypothetical protein
MKKVSVAFITAAFIFSVHAETNHLPYPFTQPTPQNNFQMKAGPKPFHQTETFVWDGEEFYNPCTDEMITLSGESHITVHGIYNNKKSKISDHINDQGITAVGESGRIYRISGANNSKETFFANGLFVTKLVRNERWTTAGSKNNYTIRESFLITVDATGKVTIEKESAEAFCR